jgi:hypothetical protein
VVHRAIGDGPRRVDGAGDINAQVCINLLNTAGSPLNRGGAAGLPGRVAGKRRTVTFDIVSMCR